MCPERFGDWLDTELLARFNEASQVFVVGMLKCIQYPVHIAVIKGGFFVELIALCWTRRTFGGDNTSRQDLLGIVHDGKSKQRVATIKSASPAHHGKSSETDFLKWTENAGEACVVEIKVHPPPS